ncbi:lytic transglycosylase domain-containing protein [Sphingomonas oryzagri]
MILAFPAALALAHQCAPGIAPEAIMSIATVESRLDPLAINVNHVGRLHATSVGEAVALATRWIAAGYSVDIGIAQINSRNLGWTGLSIASAFEPCANLAVAGKILELSYARASREASGLDAISRTFSLYNTGNAADGFRNLYVARVWHAAEQVVPQISAVEPADAGRANASVVGPPTAVAPSTPSFVVGPADPAVLVFR